MTGVELLGYAAACGTTLAFVPQVRQVWKTRSTHDISLATFSLFSVGVLLWFIYGVLLDKPPIYLANGVTLVLSLIILGFKLREKR